MIAKPKTINSSVLEFRANDRPVRRRRATSTRLLDDIDFVKRGAGSTPLLKRNEEQQLARQIFRYRLAFQRSILREEGVIEYLIDLLDDSRSGKLRIDKTACNSAA